jgi:hypothetical protein
MISVASQAEPYFYRRMKIRYIMVHAWMVALALVGATPLSAAPANQLNAKEKAAGWKLLFDGKTTQGWHTFKKQTFPDKGWVVEDGWLHCLGKGGGEIISGAEFNDFELQWDWKLARAGNSGVKYFVLDSRNEALGHEYQMLDDERAPGVDKGNRKQLTASFYAVLAPTIPPPVKPPGEINSSRIIVKGDHVEHWLNGVKVLDYECGSGEVKTAVAASKFKKTAGFGDKVKGHLLLQDHNSEVWFRNLRIREL